MLRGLGRGPFARGPPGIGLQSSVAEPPPPPLAPPSLGPDRRSNRVRRSSAAPALHRGEMRRSRRSTRHRRSTRPSNITSIRDWSTASI